MYIPGAFREEDQSVLHDFMQQNNFAVLVTSNDGQLCATHLPFYLDPSRGQHGTLVAHMARANAQWKTFDGEHEALIIFQGAHAYISPSWYEPTQTNVPTWNMAVVHAYGVPRIITDDEQMYRMLTQLVDAHELGFESPWSIQNSEASVHRQLAAIVGFEITITRLEGKFKLSQNRSETDQQHVIEALSQSLNELDRQVAGLMDQRVSADNHLPTKNR
ncbi:MAG: FMN-binding negative transcriptional regulator [Chloroflexota bacterium]